jgi:[ribosomal protein S18]-alanine N-acetyltransferase
MQMDASHLECRKLTIEWKQSLMVLLNALGASDAEYFHPHPFTDEAIESIIHNVHQDLYYILAEGTNVLGYGMLRGWDEGYSVPSLGIAIHPRARGIGLGKAFMHFLSAAARRKGATRVRLRVKRGNTRAVKLYESLGYKFPFEEDGYLVGFLELSDAH